MTLPLRLLLQYALTVLMLWLIVRFLPHDIQIDGSALALPAIAAAILLLNIFVRPILRIVTFPLKLVMTLVAIILVHGIFLWILVKVTERFDPATAILTLDGGMSGWIVVALLLGIGNWIIHHVI